MTARTSVPGRPVGDRAPGPRASIRVLASNVDNSAVVRAGVIAIGMRADLVAVDLESVRTAGAGASLDAVVFAATAADVTDVVVDDRHVVRDRQHLLIDDVARELATSVAAVLP